MTVNPNNLLKKISSPNSEVVISTLNSHIGVAEELDDLLVKHQDKDLFFVGWVCKDFTNKKKIGRTSDADIVEKNYFFIDIDIRKTFCEWFNYMVKQKELLAHIDEIKDVLDFDPLFSQRSFINCSWNWMHIFYIGKHKKFEKDEYKAGVQYIYNKFEEIFWDEHDALQAIDFSCCNIWHLARLPGSINHKKDYEIFGIEQMSCRVLYEQNVESDLFNNIPLYAKEQEKEQEITAPAKKMMQTIQSSIASAWYTKIIPGSLMDQINQKPLIDLVLSYTWRTIAPDGRNFVGGNNDDHKWCFMHEAFPNVLVIDWTTHIPNPENLQAHTTYTFIRDVLCDWTPAQAFKKAKELYPDLVDDDGCIDIENPSDHFLTYDDVLETAKKERRALDINTACKYGINILDEYLGWILPSELVVIWAETWIGKSELAFIMARENARRGKKVLLFELEGDISEIALRDMQGRVNDKLEVPLRTVQYRFNLDKSIYPIEDKALSEMDLQVKKNLLVYNKLQIPTLPFIKQIIEKMKDTADIIIIDHLHYIYLERDEELRQIGEIMRTLKNITDIIKKPIILISHLRKKNNGQKERDPSVDDLYGSSNIGKEATTVLLLSKMRAADTRSVGIELSADELDKRYCWTKILVAKSRIWLPKSAFGLIYDTQKKAYMDKYQQLLSDESFATEEDRLIDPASIEI